MDTKIILSFTVILAVILLIDLPVILHLNKDMYMQMFNKINANSINTISNSKLYTSGLFVYLLLALGILLFVLSKDNQNYKDVFIYGVAFGIITYGIYNGTNSATIKDYSNRVAITDTLWGGLLCGTTSIASLYIMKNFIYKS